MQYVLLLFFGIFLTACSTTKPFYGKGEEDWNQKQIPQIPVNYSVILMGGFDYQHSSTEESFSLLKEHINTSDTNHAIVYLNDRIYKKKKNKKDDIEKSISQKKLDEQLKYLQTDKGKLFFIAGREKYSKKKYYATEDVKNYVENKLSKKDLFYPKDGCAGPNEINLTNDLLLIPLNTSYWLWDQEKKNRDCEPESNKEWIEDIKEVIDENQRKNILVLGHHPAINLGNNGGWFSLKQHIFPLTELNKNLYIPLPFIGTLYPIIRIAAGAKNDRSYPAYNKMRRDFVRTFMGYKNLVYASGLEKNFQYFKYSGQDYIITNSSSETSFTGTIRSKFTYESSGITKLSYLENGEVWMEFIIPEKGNSKGKIVFRKQLKDNVYKSPDDSTEVLPFENVSDSTITIVANKNLKAGGFRTLLLGHHYRDAWIAPVKIPLIDLQSEQGGLKIIKKGGGNQTKSLHLEDRKGEELSLRSVVKYPENLLGPMMTNTLAADVVRDQTSSIHPYTSYIIDNLSDAAGIMHNSPKVVYIPNDKGLDEYRKEFANTLAVFEKKADGKISPVDNFMFVEEAISSEQLLKKQKKDNAVFIDDKFLLKSRLFDMWINDWDRHQDQWRWGLVKCDGNKQNYCDELPSGSNYYIPIPKDRDQAFARFDGIIPWIAGRKWTGRRFQNFSDEVRDVTGLNFNARNFDHAFLAELSREDWTRIGEELQKDLTDIEIENAIKQFPDTIFKLNGADMIQTLKSRRENIPSFTKRYYEFISKVVDVRGSDEKEIVEITRINNDSTSVKMYNGESPDRNLLFSRTFVKGETREVRIFGMGGADVFTINGKTDKSIKIRIIGGDGKDTITDLSKVNGWSKKTLFYDDKGKNSISSKGEVKDFTSKEKNINDYNYFSYKYNLVAPATFFGFNNDDGLFLGGGIVVKKQGFRKEPYSYRQRLVANVALREKSFNLLYLGDFNEVIGKWGIHADVSVLAPASTTNFFGLGNDTKRTVDNDEYYRLRYDNAVIFLGLKRRFNDIHSIKLGPVYEYINVEKTPGRYITSPEGQQYNTQISKLQLGGFKFEYEFTDIDDSVLTFRGIRWLISGITENSLDKSYSTTNFESQFRLYVPIANRATIAFRVGGATRLGDFDFFQANTLGGQTIKRENGNLRGYLRGRYSGESVLYFNTDLRMKLFTLRTYLFPSHFGILGFYDTGRVWIKGEKSTTWHSGYGGGIWIDPFAMTVINLTVAKSKEDTLITLAIGFLF